MMLQAGSNQVLALGDCLFDVSRGLLLRNDAPVMLRPKAFALLSHLAANSDHVVSKSDLMDAVWPDVIVTEDSLTQTVRELRKALADDGQSIVRTVAKRGYLLASSAPQPEADLLAGQSHVAVLRFTNEGDGSDVPIIDGFAEDIVNALARFRTVAVLARNSGFSFASEQTSDWRDIGRRLGANYLVSGKAALRADTLRASVSLIDAESGAILWNEVFSSTGAGIFDIQDEIARRVVNRLVARLDDAGLTQAARKPTQNLAAYQLLLRGLVRLRGYSEGDNQAAHGLFVAAIEKDPDYALAQSYLALTELLIAGYGEAPGDIVNAVIERARLAVTMSPEEPRCHRVLANALLQARKFEAAEHHLRRALDLNPYDADTVAQLGYLLTMRGRPLEALVQLEQAIRINPIHPDWYYYDLSLARQSVGDYRGALDSLSRLPTNVPGLLTRLAALHAQLGNAAAARKLVDELQRIAPDFSIMDFARKGIAFEHPADIEHFVEGVAKPIAAYGARTMEE